MSARGRSPVVKAAHMGGHNNSCTRAQVVLTGTPLNHAKWAPRARSSAPSPTRPRHDDAMKLEVFEAFLTWQTKDKGARNKSPLPRLRAIHKFGKNFPRDLYRHVMITGGLANTKSPGRPKEYDEDLWGRFREIHKDIQDSIKRKPQTEAVQAALAEEFEGVPSSETIRRWKKGKFVTKPCTKKPIVGKIAQVKRHAFGKARLGQSFVRWVVMDMKWFRESAAGQYEQDLYGLPVADDVRYKPKMETPTQGLKIMFMACVSEKKKIGLWEMNKEDWVKCTTKSGKPAKGIGWKFLFPFLKLIKKEATRILGPGPPIGIWLDRAPAHIAKETQAELARLFGSNVVLQPPSSPDLNMLDSGVFPNMQRKVNLKGANSIVDIRKAVNAVWDEDITTEHLSKVAGRVRRNLVMIKKLKGGNWYIEK